MTRRKCGGFWQIVTLAAITLMALAVTPVYGQRSDIPKELVNAPDMERWAVGWIDVKTGYKVVSVTKFNGHSKLHEDANILIESGKIGNWDWQVEAVPSIAPNWNDFQAQARTKKVIQEAEQSQNWLHTASNWTLAFERAHRVALYLLGREPLPLRVTLLLIPDGVKYNKQITERRTDGAPLTLAFYWQDSKPATFLEDVATTMYEYQHLLVDSKMIPAEGHGIGDQTTNDEARSQCWSDATNLALLAGSSSRMEWKASNAQAALALLQQSEQIEANDRGNGTTTNGDRGDRIPYADAYLYGRLFEVESVSGYFQEKGLSLYVEAKDLNRVNSFMSVCRAMTQSPADVTNGGYPAAQVQYVPFFPPNLSSDNANPSAH